MTVSKHSGVGVKIDEGSFLSIENTIRAGGVSGERPAERKEHINTNALGRTLV